jgi:hypothetical protein
LAQPIPQTTTIFQKRLSIASKKYGEARVNTINHPQQVDITKITIGDQRNSWN